MKKTNNHTEENIVIKGAREHNLKNIDVEIPINKFTVITGLSGSGKSTLAFDTLYAEGQRRYVESLSAYARQFLGLMNKPDVDAIHGLSPAISIDQKSASKNPRSTVGTVTEIYDYLRLLFARIGEPHCPKCGNPISSQSAESITETILNEFNNQKVHIYAPVVRGRKGTYEKLFQTFAWQGFSKVRVDADLYDLEEEFKLDKNIKHQIEILIDRITLAGSSKENKTRLQEAVETALKQAEGLVLAVIERQGNETSKLFSQSLNCPYCDISLEELQPRLFSFNSPYGACSACHGLGIEQEGEWRQFILDRPCPICQGKRLKPEALAVKIKDKSISDWCDFSIRNLSEMVNQLKLKANEEKIAKLILKEIKARLNFLLNVGLDYLTLSRKASTLSGGEAQRIRLATQIGSELRGVLYILDEPSIGLHQRDNKRLINTLKNLRDLGNTVLVVEHDAETITSADWVIDMGPGAGVQGGQIVAAESPVGIKRNKNSLTGLFLSGQREIVVPKSRRLPKGFIEVVGARENNLKNLTANFPLGVLCGVTGVSGSGKSTLVIDTLQKALAKRIYRSKEFPGRHKEIRGLDQVDKVIAIDQSPIGRTPRSNPATYIKVFDDIRSLFSQTQEARLRGYKPGRFSFNVPEGRCGNCQGDGLIRIEMNFLPDVYITCEKCKGKRYNSETLQVTYKDKTISEALEMTVEEALKFFENIPAIKRKIQTLYDVGLGYIKLGQSATTLSGGEAQRIKLTSELRKRDTGRTIYILDEPTTGLHFADIAKLLEVLNRLVDKGNTVIIIEHNLDVIKTADYLIDLGPEGGDRGGEIIAQGTPEQICQIKKSFTGQFLKQVL